jgi:hypothetical protein
MAEEQSYSTLEVRPEHHSAPEVYHPTHNPPSEDQYLQSGAPEQYKDSPYPEYAPTQQVPEPQRTNRYICGLSRRAFYIVLAVLVVVGIGAIAGGVAGGVLSHKNQSESGSSNGSDGSGTGDGGTGSNTTTNVNVLSISKLAATNMTGQDGFNRRSVFFQDPFNNLISVKWDSQNKTWTTSNITDFLRGSTTPLSVLPGTPLTSASCDNPDPACFESRLWYLDPNSIVRAVATYIKSTKKAKRTDLSDPTYQWSYDTLGGATLDTWPGSQLAATWNRCPISNCVGNWVVAYQAPSGDIYLSNHTNYSSPSIAVSAANVAANTSLTIISQHRGVWLDRLGLASEAITSGSTGSLQLSAYSGKWASTSKFEALPSMQSTCHLCAT